VEKVLLLNASYEPLNVCTWKRAVSLMLKGKAEEVEYTEKLINRTISTPSVIKLRYYVAVPYKELPFSKKNVLLRDNHTCQYCGKKAKELTVDHIIPKSKGGGNSWENLVTACAECNCKKANRTPQEAGMKLVKNPLKPPNNMRFEFDRYNNNNKLWEKYILAG
jgi:5-methylcytosine-specific restriction endonuclease McrA